MIVAAVVIALLAFAVAVVCALADGALLSVAESPGAPPNPEGVTGGLRDVTHRALSVARLLAVLVCGMFVGVAADIGHRSPQASVAIGLGAAILIMLAAELLPRELGEAVGAPLLDGLRPVVRLIESVVRPIVTAGARIDRALRRMLPPVAPAEADRDVTAEQMRQVVPPGAEVARDQRAILRRVFSLSDTEVHDVMVPRVDITGIERTTPWSEVLDRARSSEHARIPVYEDTLDHITGILFAKDLLPAVIADAEPAAGWQSLERPVAFIPESKPVDAQLRDFKASGSHIAIVVDEFGGTAGLVTIEDILEEIVGDIRDEYDREEPPIVAEDGRRFWVSGRVTLDDLSDALGHRFDREDVSTVGGLIFELVGRVPRAGQELQLDGFRVVVERVVRRRVDRVYFERLEQAAEPAT